MRLLLDTHTLLFDRLLIAQARYEGRGLVSMDKRFEGMSLGEWEKAMGF